MEEVTTGTDAPDRGGPLRTTRLAVSLGIGLVVLLLTAGVTTTSLSGQRLAANSAVVHAFDELMRSTTLMQAELAIGLTLRDLEETVGVDTVGGSDQAFARASVSLSDAQAALDLLEMEDADLAVLARSALASYLDLAQSVGRGDQIAAAELADLDEAFTSAVTALAEERERAADRTRSSDRNLALVSRLVSFLTAFVVPSAGVVVYRLLAVPRRELLRAEAALARERRMAALRLRLGTDRLAETERQLDQASFAEAGAVGRRLAHTREALLAINGAQRSSFEAVDVDRLLADAAARLQPTAFVDDGGRSSIELAGLDGLVARTDRSMAEALFALIFAHVGRSGAASVRCTRTATADAIGIELAIPDVGPGSILRNLEDRSSSDGRLRWLDRTDETELSAALEIADSLGLPCSAIETADGGVVLRTALPAAGPEDRSALGGLGPVRSAASV